MKTLTILMSVCTGGWMLWTIIVTVITRQPIFMKIYDGHNVFLAVDRNFTVTLVLAIITGLLLFFQ